jgi:hypothetical protein
MKRQKYKKTIKTNCEICNKSLYNNGLVSHIIYNHSISVDEYVKKYSEFRKIKLNVKKNKRKINKIFCNICGKEFSAVGISNHFRDTHNLTTNQYVEKYGEFRKKYLDDSHRIESNNVECEICGGGQVSHSGLIYHIKTHKMLWEDYFVKYFFDGKYPTCSCGCGEKVKLLKNAPTDSDGNTIYSRKMLSGHNFHKPGYRINTKEQRMNMRKSAIKRMKNKKGTWFNSGPSKEENELYDFIHSIKKDAVQSDREILSGLELDIVIPSMKIAFEYNGSYWHSDLFKDKKYHLNKQKDALELKYRLIHIWEPDWYNKKDIVKSTIKSILGKIDNKIYARNTVIREVTFMESNNFLEINHLQGGGASKIRYGLYCDDELISLMTFSQLRNSNGQVPKDGYFELHRFCNKLNTSVVGGASKLFKYFLKIHNPKSIISYANKDWSNGNLYDKLGMVYMGDTAVGYFYVKSKYKYNRYKFQKHKLVESGEDPLLTEYQIMLKNGYNRVWNCGNLKYEIINR